MREEFDGVKKLKKNVKLYTYVDEVFEKELNNFIERHKISSRAKLIRESIKFYLECCSLILRDESNPQGYNKDHILNVVKEALRNYSSYAGFEEDLKQILSPLKTSALLLREFDKKSEKFNGIIETIYKGVNKLENEIKERFEPELSSKIFRETDILHIEDNELDRQSIKTYFEDKGYNINSIETGEECLNILKYNRPKTILLDLNLKTSKLQGIELCKYLKDHPKYSSIPVIIMTAVISKLQKEKLLKETGAEHIIIKPINELADLDIILEYL